MALLIQFAADYQQRSPYYVKRFEVTWDRWWSQSLLQTTLAQPSVLPVPLGHQLTDLTPKAYEYHIQQRTWTLNLISSTLLPLPSGQQEYDLAPPFPPRSIQLRTWTASYNLNLIGKDQLPTGEQVSDLAPRPYSPPGLTWIQSFELNVFQQLPAGESVTDLPPRPYAEPATRTWTAWYNLNLIGKDRLTVGEQVYDRSPIAPPEILPRSWTWSFNLNLRGLDKLPTGEQVYDLSPRGPEYPAFMRGWSQNLLENTLAPPVGTIPLPLGLPRQWPNPQPFPIFGSWTQSLVPLPLTFDSNNIIVPFDWGLPLSPFVPYFERTITASYNPNLVGQDKLPFRQSDWPNPTPPYRQPDLASWIDRTKFLLQPPPFHQIDWPNPRAPQQPAQSFTASYNFNLIGKDQLPPRQTDWPNPTQPYRQPDLAGWIDRTKFWLQAQPFSQTDWPNPKPLPPAALSFTASYNPNLVGKDKLPVGDQFFDLTPKAPQGGIDLRSWINIVNLSLITPPRPPFPPFNQYDWPLPGEWKLLAERYYNRGFVSNFNIELFPPPPPPVTPPVGKLLIHNPGNEWQIYDRIREPGPVGWR